VRDHDCFSPTSSQARASRILAVASGGGHWVQLLRLRPAFAPASVTWVSASERDRAQIGDERFHCIPDGTRWSPFRLILVAMRLLIIILRSRPDIVVTTGAAPGLLALILARVLGRRTIWIDSIANVEQVSLSGRLARPFASLWLTQWPHLARPEGPTYQGAVLA